MRWPLYLTVNVCLIALVAAGLLGIVEQSTRAEAAERSSMSRTLNGLLAGWDAAGTPPEKRVLDVFVGAEPEDSFLDAPQPRPFWDAPAAWLRRSASKARHASEEETFLGRERPVSDWYAEDWVWASERRQRLKALSAALAKARQANARIVVLSDGREAATVLAAVRAAEPSTTDLVVADRLIVFGVDADAMMSLKYPDPTGVQFPAKIREVLLLQRASPGAGPQLVLRDAYGRVVSAPLSGDDATDDGAARLIRLLAASDADMASVLAREHQIAALPPPPPDPALMRRLAEQAAARRDAAAAQASAAASAAPTASATAASTADAAARARRSSSSAPAPEPTGAWPPPHTPPAGYVAHSTAEMAFDAPKNWEVPVNGYLQDKFYRPEEDGTLGTQGVYLGSQWYSAGGKTSGWADIEITGYPAGGPRHIEGSACDEIAIRSVQDIRDELDCSLPQTCAPCAGKKCPRGPLGGHCGKYVGRMAAAGAQGYLYREVFDPEDIHDVGPDINFNRVLRMVKVVVRQPGVRHIFVLEYSAPESEFDRYLPVFENVARSLRAGPGT